MFFGVSKLVCASLYCAALLSVFLEVLQPHSQMLLMATAVLAVVHGLEIVMMKKRLQALPGSTANHIVQTLLFGFLHWMPEFKKHGV